MTLRRNKNAKEEFILDIKIKDSRGYPLFINQYAITSISKSVPDEAYCSL